MKIGAHDVILVTVATALAGGCSSVRAENAQLEKSRFLVQSFGASLKTELKKGLAQGGPVQAVAVCKDRAPQLASELSRQSGAKVSRTSLRYRNPANAPEPWQVKVLQEFENQTGAHDVVSTQEYFIVEDDGTTRYMSEIRTSAVCLTCHGKSLPAELEARLEADYPHDRALNYDLGEVRGAFSVSWPPPGETPGR